MMRVVIAPDSFKGSLSALQVAEAIRSGIHRVDAGIETVIHPMADGGEGTVQAMIDASGGQIIRRVVRDPLFRPIDSFYGLMGDGKTAVIEMAAASGLPLLTPDERNPLKATTYGTGELILDALKRGCTRIILGLGGSATNDGGTGMARALGVRFLDEHGNEIEEGGGALLKISSIDISGLDPGIENAEFIAACDVANPLCGREGASEVYGRQKGASDADVKILDANLAHLAEMMKNEHGMDKSREPGAGAAGGLGYGALVFLKCTLERGIDIVARMTDLPEKMTNADLVITGEGRIDHQTAFGKTPWGVARIAKSKNIPVIGIAGSLGENYQALYAHGFDGIFSIIDRPMSLEEAFERTEELLGNTAESILRSWMSLQRAK